MARTGRPKSDEPKDKKDSVRFTNEEYEILLEYAKNHELSVTQAIKMSLRMNILSTQKQCKLSIPRKEEKMAARKDGKDLSSFIREAVFNCCPLPVEGAGNE